MNPRPSPVAAAIGLMLLAILALALPGVTLNDWASGMIFAGWPILTTFIILYVSRSPWRATIASRALMILVVALWLLYALSAANSVWGYEWPYRSWIRAFVFTLITVAQTYLLWTLIKLQRRDRLPKVVPPEEARGLARETNDKEK